MSTPDEAPPAANLTILVCRGCCCGTAQKHPDVDHEAQLRVLEAAAAKTAGARVRAVDCVDECSRSNVIVVRQWRVVPSITWAKLASMVEGARLASVGR